MWSACFINNPFVMNRLHLGERISYPHLLLKYLISTSEYIRSMELLDTTGKQVAEHRSRSTSPEAAASTES